MAKKKYTKIRNAKHEYFKQAKQSIPEIFWKVENSNKILFYLERQFRELKFLQKYQNQQECIALNFNRPQKYLDNQMHCFKKNFYKLQKLLLSQYQILSKMHNHINYQNVKSQYNPKSHHDHHQSKNQQYNQFKQTSPENKVQIKQKEHNPSHQDSIYMKLSTQSKFEESKDQVKPTIFQTNSQLRMKLI